MSGDDAIGLCLAGVISPQVALSRLLLAGGSPESVAVAVAGWRPAETADPAAVAAWRTLSALLAGRREMLVGLAGEIAAGCPDPQLHPLGSTAAFFDRAVAFSPEASVALYSLGDPVILAEASDEIMRWLDGHGWAGRDADVLDLGCGIGRISTALAVRCRSVLGLDVSAGMVAEARRRCAGLSNVRVEHTAGVDLDGLADDAFDLVIAVDSFPYVVQAGKLIVARHVAGAARIIRSGGHLVVLNLSYGRDLAADQADAQAWARQGFAVRVAGERPFALWDGAAFVLERL